MGVTTHVMFGNKGPADVPCESIPFYINHTKREANDFSGKRAGMQSLLMLE